MFEGVSIIFWWVVLIIFLIYGLEFVFKSKMKVHKSLNPVLVLQITKEDDQLEKKLKSTFFKLNDLTTRGVETNVVVLCTLQGNSLKTVQRICRHRNLTLVETYTQLTQYFLLKRNFI